MKVIIVLILFSRMIFADPRGDISFSYTTFTTQKDDQASQNLSSSFQVQDDGDLFGLNYRFDVIGKVNNTLRNNSYLNINEAVVDFKGPFLETYKIGYQIYNWSKLESFHPANIINSNYIDGDLESFKKKGEMSIVIDNEIVLGNLKLYYFPFFENNFYPSSDTRIVDGFKSSRTIYLQGEKALDDKVVNQFGLTLKNNIGETDFLFFAFKHIDRNNTIIGYDEFATYPFYGNVPTGKLSVIHCEVLDVGLSLTSFFDVHTLKLEAVHSAFNSDKRILTTNGVVSFVDQTKLALGHEYTYSFESGYDLTFFLEYQTIFFEKNKTILSARDLTVFQNDIFIGQRFVLNDIAGSEFKFGLFFDLDNKNELLFFLNYERRLNDFWKFKTSYRHIEFHENDKSGLYLLKDDNEVSLSLTRYF